MKGLTLVATEHETQCEEHRTSNAGWCYDSVACGHRRRLGNPTHTYWERMHDRPYWLSCIFALAVIITERALVETMTVRFVQVSRNGQKLYPRGDVIHMLPNMGWDVVSGGYRFSLSILSQTSIFSTLTRSIRHWHCLLCHPPTSNIESSEGTRPLEPLRRTGSIVC